MAESNDSPSKLYRPLSIPDSPLSRQGNLTGTPRCVRDYVATIHNLVQAWNENQIEGMKVISSIVDLKLPFVTDPEKRNTIESYTENLQKHCDALEAVCLKFKSISDELRQCHDYFRGLEKLEAMRNNNRPIFFTWPIGNYVKASGNIYNAYNQEIDVKTTVKEHIAHTDCKETLMLFAALWAHQAYIDSDLSLELEAMLHETAHR